MGRLLCRKCHDQTEIPVCGACRRPVEGRVVRALDKSWHIEHFVCHYCEKPFMNDTYFVGPSDDKPYCEYHYNKLFGDSCTYCGCVIQTQVSALPFTSDGRSFDTIVFEFFWLYLRFNI